MILQVVTRQRMNQHTQPLSVLIKPENKGIKLLEGKEYLTTPLAMRADEVLMNLPHFQPKLFTPPVHTGSSQALVSLHRSKHVHDRLYGYLPDVWVHAFFEISLFMFLLSGLRYFSNHWIVYPDHKMYQQG